MNWLKKKKKKMNKLIWLDHVLYQKQSKDSKNRGDKVSSWILIKFQNKGEFALLLEQFYCPYGRYRIGR